MASPRVFAISTGIFLALAAGFGSYGLHSAHQSEAAVAAVKREQFALAAKLQKAQQHLAARQGEIAVTEAKLKNLAQTRPAAAPAPAAPIPLDGNALNRVLAANPKLRDLHLQAFRASLPLRFEAMYQKLGLSQAQIDKFEEMATAHEDDRETMYTTAVSQGMNLSDPNFEALHQQSITQYYGSLASEISPALAQEVTQMDQVRTREGPVQAVVSQVNNLIPPGSPPLTAGQTAQLTQLLANASPGFQSGGNADINAIDWTNVSTQAGAILSAPQLKALQTQAQLLQLTNRIKQFYSQAPVGN